MPRVAHGIKLEPTEQTRSATSLRADGLGFEANQTAATQKSLSVKGLLSDADQNRATDFRTKRPLGCQIFVLDRIPPAVNVNWNRRNWLEFDKALMKADKPGMKALFAVALLTIRCGIVVFAAEGLHDRPDSVPPGVKPLEAPGLHNVFAVGANVFSGSSPEGEGSFASLKKLGVKTILSVDGAKPDVETARKHGMRYVHLPHGYDGISTNLQLQLAKASETLAGPIYVHCHHGRHRGPTAAAVICQANSGWTAAEAEAWLVAAGTAPQYTGLYDVVRNFSKPTKKQLGEVSCNFPETAQVSGLVDAMVDIDHRWDHLKAVRTAGYQVPREHPDIKPANEAVILWEHYREAQRLADGAHHGAQFIERLKAAEIEAKEAERLLRLFAADPKREIRAQLDETFDAMAKTCSACHKTHRDAAGIRAKK